jgi:hypothetical protein
MSYYDFDLDTVDDGSYYLRYHPPPTDFWFLVFSFNKVSQISSYTYSLTIRANKTINWDPLRAEAISPTLHRFLLSHEQRQKADAIVKRVNDIRLFL